MLSLAAGCAAVFPAADAERAEESVPETVRPIEKAEATEGVLRDNRALYEAEDNLSVITMYLTVSRGNSADGSDHTWEEVNAHSAYYYNAKGIDRYKAEGILQIDETGEGVGEGSFGYGETVPNVSVQIRGQASSQSAQKNYKIRIKEDRGTFRGQRTLNLNKHQNDPYRFLNKLSYDLLTSIPQLLSGRTQFVHLYVDDRTEDHAQGFADYGLYTMVEQVNRTYLRSHGLDENGQLYKVNFFEWGKYEAVMMSPDDPEFDRAQLESYLEIKGDEDLGKLQSVIEQVNNYAIPIERIIDEHFDAENICYWMAFNILIGNYDVGARNLFLYSPLNSQKFYMICWDMDAAFRTSYLAETGYHEAESWEHGLTQYLGLTLIRRMMQAPAYRQMLMRAVDDLYQNHITAAVVSEKVERCRQVTAPFLFAQPDLGNAPIRNRAVYDRLTARIGSEVDANYAVFQESLQKPWPFFVGVPAADPDGEGLVLTWGASYDCRGEEITYRYVLARDPLFTDVIDREDGLRVPLAVTGSLTPGTYFLRVVATNASGRSMECFDYYNVDDYGKSYGCYAFVVHADGTITALESGET